MKADIMTKAIGQAATSAVHSTATIINYLTQWGC